MIMNPTITLTQLRKLRACSDSLTRFRELFGDSVELTVELAEKHASDFPANWCERYLLNRYARAEFKRVRFAAWAECERSAAPARAEYERVEAAARAEFKRVEAPARAEYERRAARCFAELYIRQGGYDAS